MSRDFDDIYKKIDQSYKDLYKNNDAISKDVDGLGKNQDKILKDITEIKREVRDIAHKVDIMLEILNNFTIMLAEDDEDLDENYDIDDADESWVPKEEWEDDEDDELDG